MPALVGAGLGYLRSMPPVFRYPDVVVEQVFVERLLNQVGNVLFRTGARFGVDDECYLFLFLHICVQKYDNQPRFPPFP